MLTLDMYYIHVYILRLGRYMVAWIPVIGCDPGNGSISQEMRRLNELLRANVKPQKNKRLKIGRLLSHIEGFL